MTKVPCYNLFITYSKTFFRIILLKIQKNIDKHSDIEELRHKINTNLSDVTNSVARLCRMPVILSPPPRSKYMVSGYQPGRADKGQETQYHIYKLWVIT